MNYMENTEKKKKKEHKRKIIYIQITYHFTLL